MIGGTLRQFVRGRAGERCEYCRLPEFISEIPFHIEHIVAQQHIVDDDAANLALACDRCNLHKGPNIASINPDTGRVIRLFNPRKDKWSDHFEFADAEVVGRTPRGKATVRLLNMNTRQRVLLREILLDQGEVL